MWTQSPPTGVADNTLKINQFKTKIWSWIVGNIMAKIRVTLKYVLFPWANAEQQHIIVKNRS